jgi:hypothetical protein
MSFEDFKRCLIRVNPPESHMVRRPVSFLQWLRFKLFGTIP